MQEDRRCLVRPAAGRSDAKPHYSDLDSRLVEVGDEQSVIARILAMRSAGASFATIAAALDTDGVPTKKGRGGWSWRSVQSIVERNETNQTIARAPVH